MPAKPPPNRSAYKAEHKSEARSVGRDIGSIPAPLDQLRRDSCERDLLRFLTTYMAARFPLDFSDDHLRVIAALQTTILDGGQFALAMPRGSGKTTVFEGGCVWAMIYGHRRFVMVVAADAPAAEDICASLRAELDGNDEIAADFPEATLPIRKLEGIARRAEGQTSNGTRTHLTWTKNQVRLPCFAAGGGSVIRTAGITGRIRGAKSAMADGSQVRPDLVLVDDPQTDESARSPSQVATRYKTMTSTVLGLAGPGEKIACLATCTVIERNDLADQLLDRKAHPEWQGYRARLLRSMPTGVALWDAYAEIIKAEIDQGGGKDAANEFYIANREAMDAGADASWPERKEPGDVSAIQHAMDIKILRGDVAFFAEYQNEPLDAVAASGMAQITPPAVLRKINQHDRGIVPTEAAILTASIDVHDKALCWMVCAWSPGFGGDIIDYGFYPDQGRLYFTMKEVEKTMVLAHPGASWEAALHASLDALVNRLMGTYYARDDGGFASVEQLIIDAGYGNSTDTIYGFCRRSPFRAALLPYFGDTIAPGATPMNEYKKKPGVLTGDSWRSLKPEGKKGRRIIADANRWKSFVADRVLSPPGSAGSLGIFGNTPALHRMLADQLSAESRMQISANGRVSDRWTAKPNQDNHYLDNLAMAAIGASIRGLKLDPQASRIMAAPPPPTDGETPAADPCPIILTRPPPTVRPIVRNRSPSGFLSSYGKTAGF